MDQKIKLQNICCPRCGDKLDISKFQSNVKAREITGYCFNTEHVYSPVKIMVVNTIKLIMDGKREIELKPGYNLKKMKCIICSNKIYFDKHASFQIGSKVVGDCLKEGHRIELTYVSKVVDEPDCKEIIQVKMRDSTYGL